MDFSDAAAWAMSEFGNVNLGHKARTTRAVKIAAAAAAKPDVSIPKIFDDWAGAKAAYTFFANAEVHHDQLLAGHFDATVARARGRRMILVIQDDTYARYGGKARLESGELGPIDTKGKVPGLVVHTALAVDFDTHEVLGLLDQKIWTRKKKNKASRETRAERLARPRESEKWGQGHHAAGARLAALGDDKPHVVAVYDREGDIYSAISRTIDDGNGFVIRAVQNRRIESDEPEAAYILDALIDAPIVGTRFVHVPKAPKRPERLAKLTLRATTVEIQAPAVSGHVGQPLEINIVTATEEEAPPDVESLSWILLTSLPVETLEDVIAVVRSYEARWLIEEFHMGLKTGCSIERRQLHTCHALENIIAMSSAIAVRLLCLRDCARRSDLLAREVLSASLFTVLQAIKPKLTTDSTAREALRAIATMGGFLARARDGEPGWRTLWSGFKDLLLAEKAWKLAKETG